MTGGQGGRDQVELMGRGVPPEFVEVLWPTEQMNGKCFFEIRTFSDSGNGHAGCRFYRSVKDLVNGLRRIGDPAIQRGLGVFHGIQPRVRERGKDVDVEVAVALALDFDGGVEEARKKIAAIPIKPTATVKSGHGIHAYWCLKEPWPFDSTDAYKRLVQGMAEQFGADTRAVNVSRTLRMPGSYNLKDPENPLLVTLETIHPERRYVIEQFLEYQKPAVPKPRPHCARVPAPEGGTPYGRTALEDECERVRTARRPQGDRPGERNDQLFRSSAAIGELVAGGELQEHPARDALIDAGVATGLAASSVRTTVESGFSRGLEPPRNAPPNSHSRPPPPAPTRPDSEVVSVGDEVGALILDPGNPRYSARRFVEESYYRGDVRTLHRHRDEFFSWRGSHYAAVSNNEVKAELYSFLEPAWRKTTGGFKPFKPTRSKVIDVLDALQALVHTRDELEVPVWLAPEVGPDPRELLACENGLLHLATGKLLAHSPSLLALNAVDYAYDPDAPSPERWLAFLEELWTDDRESRDCLQDWAGYILAPDTSLQKILMIVGPRRSGKGTIGRVLAALVGHANVCAPTLSSLGQPFGLQSLLGKRLAIISDARLGRRTDEHVVAERLLSISGEDFVEVPRKFKTSWTGRLPTRFMILTNELPKISDSSGALPSRLVVLMLRKSFYGKEDSNLTNKLLAERPGILRWALTGWRRLQNRGRFHSPASADEAARVMEDLSSPVTAFVRQRCATGPECLVPVDKLYGSWVASCTEHGREHIQNAQTFGRDLQERGESCPHVPGDPPAQSRRGARMTTRRGTQWNAHHSIVDLCAPLALLPSPSRLHHACNGVARVPLRSDSSEWESTSRRLSPANAIHRLRRGSVACARRAVRCSSGQMALCHARGLQATRDDPAPIRAYLHGGQADE